MQSKNSFVAGLFVMALCGFVAGGIGLYQHVDYRLHAQQADMMLADPDQKVIQLDDVMSYRTLDVRYVSEAGEVVVPQKSVPKDMADRLAGGDRIAITYLTNNPKRVFYYGQRPPIPWGWLMMGVIALLVAMYALKLRKREAEPLPAME